jgi:hypothetical protein
MDRNEAMLQYFHDMIGCPSKATRTQQAADPQVGHNVVPRRSKKNVGLLLVHGVGSTAAVG